MANQVTPHSSTGAFAPLSGILMLHSSTLTLRQDGIRRQIPKEECATMAEAHHTIFWVVHMTKRFHQVGRDPHARVPNGNSEFSHNR